MTLGVPVFQGERYLPATLQSLCEQDYPDLEIVISDNGSTDATEDICRSAASTDDRISYHRSPVNRGGPWNFNNVIALARGDLFKIAAADDLVKPRFVTACVQALDQSGPEAVLACPRTQLIDADGKIFDELDDSGLQVDQPHPYQRMAAFFRAEASHLIYGLMRTEVLRTTRGIRPVVGDDFVMLVELASRGHFVLVPEQLFLQRRHGEQFSAQGQGQVAWHDPKAQTRSAFPQTKFDIDLGAAIMTSPIDRQEKLRCLLATLRLWVLPRWRAIARDLIEAAGISVPSVLRRSQ